MSGEAELKACPHCAATVDSDEGVSVVSVGRPSGEWCHVECNRCTARGPMARTAERAAELWNRRPPPPASEAGDAGSAIVERLRNYLRAIARTSTGRDAYNAETALENLSALEALLNPQEGSTK